MIKNIEALKSVIDVIDIVGNYVELKKAGANYKAPCPFHSEATASFVASPQKQIAHCFGCGWSGDAIKFVQEHKHLSFAEAVEDIANELNFTLEYESSDHTKDYSKIMASVQSLYVSQLSQPHRDYLIDRGLTDESIAKFEIGYSGTSRQQVDALNKQLHSTQDGIECGILAQDEAGKVYARLNNRITFPVRNHAGKLIAWGGRITKGEGAKYINTPSTKLFDKSRTFYGYNHAKKAIHEVGTFVITEGYLDVIMMHQAGIHTAVATMGTALTDHHCAMIKKSQSKVLLCFDGDRAGIAAAIKAAKLLSVKDIFGGVVLFPEGKDPADMIAAGDTEAVYTLMKRKKGLIEFVIEHIVATHDLNVPAQKQAALNEVRGYLTSLSALMQDEYRHYAAAILSVAPHHIGHAEAKPVATSSVKQKINIAELNIIKTAREHDGCLNLLLDFLDRDAFTHHAREFDLLLAADPMLDGLLLREELSVYSYDDFVSMIKIMRIQQAQKQIFDTAYANESWETRAQKLRHMKKTIEKIKKGVAFA